MKLNDLLRCVLILSVPMTSGGCYLGPQVDIPLAAYRPAGMTVTLETEAGGIVGELLAVHANELVVLSPNPNRLLTVSFVDIVSGNAILVGDFQASDLRGGRLETLRRISRYPQGIDSELEASLLSGYGIARMERVEP